jgi:hypothetical protein
MPILCKDKKKSKAILSFKQKFAKEILWITWEDRNIFSSYFP